MSQIEVTLQINHAGFNLNLDCMLPDQGITAIFGPSGSGKTTLLRFIAGLERGAKGTLRVDGALWHTTHYCKPTHERQIGYVFQEASLLPHLDVMGNLNYGRKRAQSELQTDLDGFIDLLGIRHLLNRMPEYLSGGEKSRVAIARALATNPQMLLMDEPLASLDWQRKREILPYLKHIQQALHIPIFYVTHSPSEVIALADFVVVLADGRITASGLPSEVLANELALEKA